ncbi:hypothetical protein ES703_100612 [subsurface metagenome]
MIKRIAQGVWHGLCPFFELFIIARIAGDILFGYAVGPHCPPFVMVAVKPGLRDVIKLMVGGYLVGGEVTVVVIDGHFLGVFVVKSPCGFCLQEKIFCNKLASHFSVLEVNFDGIWQNNTRIS